MFVKPAEGRLVPDLELRDFLPPEGRKVTPSEYWTRRLLDGDVTEGDERGFFEISKPAAAVPAPAPEPPARPAPKVKE